MNMAVDGNNFFHTGWLARMLDLPEKHPNASSLRREDVLAFEDGWEMCNDTPQESRLEAYYRMKKSGQAACYWVDDDNNEIEEK